MARSPRLAHGALDDDRRVVDLRDFLLEQLDEQRRVGPREHDLRALGAAIHGSDHGAHPVAGRVALGARLFLARQHCFDAADLDDDVAVLEALHGAADDVADALVVLGEDVLALGLPDLLEDHLLGRLGRDAPEHLGRLGELDLHVDFGFLAVDLLRVDQRDLRRGVGHLGDDLLDGVQFHLARLGVEPRSQVLVRLVVLA